MIQTNARQIGFLFLVLLTVQRGNAFADAASQLDFATVRPVLERYCFECHNDKVSEAEIDFTNLANTRDVRKIAKTWQHLVEVVETHQMPPKDARQWTEEERNTLLIWSRKLLREEATATAGDPGPVLLRRLNNAELTYALRDLTGIESLDPAKEFPVDGAAGEGFTNASTALSMSPSLVTKYLDAAKNVSQHLVLLPTGTKFSKNITSSDWTNDAISEIRNLYALYSDQSGGSSVNLQGIVFDTNQGGRLAVEKYVKALAESRAVLQAKTLTIEQLAKQTSLNARYLGRLWTMFHADHHDSLLLNSVQHHWVQQQGNADKNVQSESLSAQIAQWQKSLWRFSSIGHIGKVNGPKAWQEPINPLSARQELRSKIPADHPAEMVTYYLAVGDAGDGNAGDYAIIERPRLIMEGRPDLLLRDVRPVASRLKAHRAEIVSSTQACLAVAAEAQRSTDPVDVGALAQKYQIKKESLAGWFDFLGIGVAGDVSVHSLINRKAENFSGYDFIQGWTGDDALSIAANASDQHVRIPGNMLPHSIAVHPAPTRSVCIGWKSPIATELKMEGFVQHAHPECGNGIAWSLELRRGNTRQTLAKGFSQGGNRVAIGPIDAVAIRNGDLVSLVVSPRDGNHSCDLTTVDLQLTGKEQSWNLAKDVSSNILTGNPHSDLANTGTPWVFYSEPTSTPTGHAIPTGSLLARWQSTSDVGMQKQIASEIQQLLIAGPNSLPADSPDRLLHQQLTTMGGPLMGAAFQAAVNEPQSSNKTSEEEIGLPPLSFGKHPNGTVVEAGSLCVQAPAVIEIRLPKDLVAGAELVASGYLHPETGREGSVQIQLLSERPAAGAPTLSSNQPVVVQEGSPSRKKFEKAFDDFRALFPIALCYTKIVPVDEVVTLTLFYREDEYLQKLMLNDEERQTLDRLWDELHFHSRDALTLVDAYEQLWQYATQDADPTAFEPLRDPILKNAAAFREQLKRAEPIQLESLFQFASRAYRRPLTSSESRELKQLYQRLREQEITHEDAIRLTFARILVSPAFLYRMELPADSNKSSRVSDYELATRLSFFLWSSVPDNELLELAAKKKLGEPAVLEKQVARMLQDSKSRRLATEFACQWLHVYDFEHLDEKSEQHFPTFGSLRSEMYEESIRFFANHFQNDRPFLELFDADYAFLNEALAKHYEIPGVNGPEWRKVDGVKKHHRGGVLTMASALAKQSGASRTSPILRGNWLSEVVLGEKLPRPPKNVPQLGETAPTGMTERQMIERHSSDAACSKCHERIDPFGYSLEAYDAIGRYRRKDANGLAIDTKTQLADKTPIAGLDDLKDYLTKNRRMSIARQFNKKLIGYALGRSVQLSDEPLIEELTTASADQNIGLQSIVQRIIASPQFREIRGTKHE